MIEYRWKVQPEPTGRYRSFEHRSWPVAETPAQDAIALIGCEDSYTARRADDGNHAPLTLYIRTRRQIPGTSSWRWARFKSQFDTLANAKTALQRYIEKHPEHDFALPEATP